MDTAHPSLEQLSQLAEGLHGALARSRLEQHVMRCARCSAELDWLTTTITHLRLEATEAVPESVVTRARRLFHTGDARVRADTHVLLERLAGVLRFDSATMQPAFGVRGGDDSPTRQLLFEAGPFELELHTAAARSGWSISGQLLGPTDATSGEVRLIGSRANARSELTEMLEFNLPVVPAGRYRLELLVGGTTQVEIDSLELGL
jgi:hypothetical protein